MELYQNFLPIPKLDIYFEIPDFFQACAIFVFFSL